MSPAQSTVSREYAIKAAFLYNFGQYVRWPANAFGDPGDPFVIAVLGPDPFGETLNVIASTKRLGGRNVVIQRIDALEPEPEARCHILFIPDGVATPRQLEAMGRFRGAPVLVVGETPGFTGRGGAIELYIRHNKVRFRIDRQAAGEHQLAISSRLLDLEKRWEEESSRD
ncbi:MAG: YfiR family protein [Pirellulales bacterium]|nr:YfiR family protein [Pirellulales bacterium]